MGCINTKAKRLDDLRDINLSGNNNFIRIKVLRLQCPDVNSPTAEGLLELCNRELIFTSQCKDRYVWALQHLRRYGLNNNIFSFEAGRRCERGAGIYTFRCLKGAERFFHLFQRYINDVTSLRDEAFASYEHPIGRLDVTHTNNYLEPEPSAVATRNIEILSALETDLESPISLQSMTFDSEVVQFQNLPRPCTFNNVNSSGNVYLEHPISVPSTQVTSVNNITIIHSKTITKTVDVPPNDHAPALSVNKACASETHPMYVNVEALGKISYENEVNKPEFNERCYENISNMDVTKLLSNQSSGRQEASNFENTVGGVNYIVLDLDQTRSPASSPHACFGSVQSLQYMERSHDTDSQTVSGPAGTNLHPVSGNDTNSGTSLGYSTIDFIRTCALIKSSTCGDFDSEHDLEQDQEESRLTRHSKCVRKAFSVSE